MISEGTSCGHSMDFFVYEESHRKHFLVSVRTRANDGTPKSRDPKKKRNMPRQKRVGPENEENDTTDYEEKKKKSTKTKKMDGKEENDTLQK